MPGFFMARSTVYAVFEERCGDGEVERVDLRIERGLLDDEEKKKLGMGRGPASERSC